MPRLTEVLPELMVRPARRYPAFTAPTPDEARAVARAARRLAGQTKLNVRADQILVAPWIGRVVTPSGKKLANSLGYRRDAAAFWRTYLRLHPVEARLLRGGRRVTPAYAKAMGWPRSTVGKPLEHHHIGNLAYVFPLPKDVHGGAPVHGRATILSR